MKKNLYFTVFLFIFSLSSYQIFAQSITSGPKPVIDQYLSGAIIPLPVILIDPLTSEILTYEATILCGQTSVELTAQFTDVGVTDSYAVESIPYSPIRFGFEGFLPGANIIVPNDDMFSGLIDLNAGGGTDFEFCFFQNIYDQFVINDNGVVTFDLSFANQVVGGNPANGGWRLLYNSAEAAIAGTNPNDPIQLGNSGNQFLLNNSIYLPGQDLFSTNLQAPGEFYYNVYGIAPNRKMVIGMSEVPMYGCFSTTQTHQLIIYETTNIMEIHIQNIDICDTWNGGFTLIGIQNDARNNSFVVPNRDTDAWNAYNESWRFVPNGTTATTPTFAWYEGYVDEFNVGTLISNNPNHVFSPLVNTTYTAEVRYTETCSGLEIVSTVEVDIILANDLLGEIVEDATLTPIEDIFFCAGSGATFDVKAKVVFDPLMFFVDYQWREVSTNSIVSVQETYTIDSATIESAGNLSELYEVTMSLYLIGEIPGVDPFTCAISDTVNVIIGTPSFDGLNPIYCIDDVDPFPTNIWPFATSRVFTINNGGFIDANTGEIDLNASGFGTDSTGNFTVTLTAGIVPSNCTFSFNITIQSSPTVDTLQDVFACDTYILPVLVEGNYYTESNGNGTLLIAGDIIAETQTIYIYAETGTTPNCSDESSFSIILTEYDDSSFSYSDTYAISDTNPIPTNIVTLGGVFTINNGAVINPTTGEIDLTSTTVGETYLITYTTNGMCPASSTFAITIVENAINYPNAVVEISGDNPIPIITISGGTFTIDNGASINETTGEVFLNTTTVNTTYTINYTYNNLRINTYTFELTVVNTLSIEDDLLNNNVSIFPNPTKNVFTLKNESNFKLEKLEIISYLGKLIKTVPLTNMDLEKQILIKNLTAGVYFIKITSKNGKISKKLIVK